MDEPSIVIEPNRYDFGEIYEGARVQSEVLFKNVGTADLVVKSIDFSCGCAIPRIIMSTGEVIVPEIKEITEIKPCIDQAPDQGIQVTPKGKKKNIFSVAPGEWAKMEIHFQSFGRAGNISHFMDVFTNDPENYRVHIPIKAFIKVPFTLKPKRAHFGKLEHDQKKSLTIRVESIDHTPFEINSIKNLPPYLSYEVSKPEKEEVGVALLTLNYLGGASSGFQRLNLKVDVEHEGTEDFLLFMEMQIAPQVIFEFEGKQIFDTLDLGQVIKGEERVFEINILNGDLKNPYNIIDLVCKSFFKPVATVELVAQEPGYRYKIRVTLPAEVDSRFMRGRLILFSDHPDISRVPILFRGFVKDPKEEDSPEKEDPGTKNPPQ